MGELNLRGTKVTLKGDVCFIKNIPDNFSIVLNQGTYTNSSRSGNGIKEACSEMTSSNPRTFGNMVINLDGGKKRQQTMRQQAKREQAKRQQTRRQKTRRQQAKRQQTRRQSKLKK